MDILLSGEIQMGKTTVCLRVAEQFCRLGYQPGGVVTPAVFEEDVKVGIRVVDLQGGEKMTLARADRKLGGPRVGRYSFDSAALRLGSRAIKRAVASGCDLLIVDEIGPLELELGEGFALGLDVVRTGVIPHTLTVVRKALAEELRTHLREITLVVLEVTEENRNELPSLIVQRPSPSNI